MNESYAYGMWSVAFVNIAIFVFFVLGYLRPRKRREWQSMGTYSAFVVALFTEMYGFPLTIYILTSVLGSRYPVIDPFSHMNGHLWVTLAGGSTYVWLAVMLISNVAMFGGLVIVGKAWRQIHDANGKLVTRGLYGRTRHPQYLGLLVITTGMLIQWPTILTAAMWPILMYMYYRLALREEKEMEAAFGDSYREYRRRVPMLPRPGRAGSRLTA